MSRIVASAVLVLTLAVSGCAAASTSGVPGAGTTPSMTGSSPSATSVTECGNPGGGLISSTPSGSASPHSATECGNPGGGIISTSGTPSATASATVSAARASLAVTTLAGDTFDPAVTAGRPVILWFWAPWCTICRAEAPDVNEVVAELEKSGSPVIVLGVPGRGKVPEMNDFVADTKTEGLTHLVDAEGVLWREYGVVTQPAFALLGVDGEVELINGALGADGLRDAAARLSEG